MNDTTPSQQIDEIIQKHSGWKGDAIKHIRAIIKQAAPDVTEEIKWKMANRPEGLPVWEYKGIVCYIETWKDNTKLIFFKGSQLSDPNKLFNARLKSASIRAIELHEGDLIDAKGVKALVLEAIELNVSKYYL
ncbi:MAG: DUF1801 domain-containing protein [Candidatus Saccharimonadaceae bacterium]